MILEYVIIISMLVVFALAVTIVPLTVGAVKKRKVLKPVEFLPPRGASPIDVLIEYYGASGTPREIFNPLLLYWASRGFVTIEEDCKRGLKVTKLKDLEPPENQYGYASETFKMEKKLFDDIFWGKTKNFYTLSAHRSFKDTYSKIISDCRKEARGVCSKQSERLSIASCVISWAIFIIVAIITSFYLENDTLILMIAFPIFASVMAKIVLSLPGDNGGVEKGSAIRFFMYPFFTMAGAIPFIVMVAMLPLYAGIMLSIALAVCVLNVFVLSVKIDIRTNERLEKYAKICGFKKFLLKAESRQLEMLVEQDPQYFYNILPYCYILKITKKLKPKFDRFALDGPAWYLGELRDILMF